MFLKVTLHNVVIYKLNISFRQGHQIPKMAEDVNNSLVQYKDCPTPQILNDAFYKISHTDKILPPSDPKSREDVFINAQWALGGAGTGAPV